MTITASIRAKLLGAFVAASVVSIMAVGWQGHRSGREALEEASYEKLISVRETKARQIEAYVRQIRDQVQALAHSPATIEAVQSFRAAFHQDAEPLEAADQAALGAYYADEFVPRLEANTHAKEAPDAYVPDGETAAYFQVQYLAGNPHPVGEKDALLQAGDGTAYSALHETYHPVFKEYVDRFGYYDIFLIDPETGHIVYSVFKETDYATSLFDGPYADSHFGALVQEVRQTRDAAFVRMTDFAPYAPSYAAPASFVATPIFDGGALVGILAFQMPITRINDVMTGGGNWAEEGLGRTGEAYLLGSDFRMRSDSRFLTEDREAFLETRRASGADAGTTEQIGDLGTTILLHEVRTEASEAALAGTEGQALVEDYRGVPVFSAYAPLDVPDVEWAVLAEIDVAEALAPASTLARKVLLWALGLILLTGAFAFVFTGRFTRPILTLHQAAERVAEGETDVAVDIQRADEVGALGSAFNTMVERIRHTLEEAERQRVAAEAAADEAQAATAQAEAQQAYLAQSVDRMLAEMDRFASGDLAVHLEPERDDEIGQLYHGFNRAAENLRAMLEHVGIAVGSTTAAAAQIGATVQQLAAGTQEQSAQADEVAAAVEQMSRTITENARSTTHAAGVAQRGGQLAVEGQAVVQETIEKIRTIAAVVSGSSETVGQLGASSQRIGDIVQTIQDIADQTNLLALNAAIEAARAGDQGRGFAVVADEVRKLAERTTGATQEIATMIATVQEETRRAVDEMQGGRREVEEGIRLADRTGASLEQLVATVQEIEDLIAQIATASEEQSITSEQITHSITGITTVSAESAAGVGQIAQATDGLNRLAGELRAQVEQFNTSSTHPSVASGDGHRDAAAPVVW